MEMHFLRRISQFSATSEGIGQLKPLARNLNVAETDIHLSGCFSSSASSPTLKADRASPTLLASNASVSALLRFGVAINASYLSTVTWMGVLMSHQIAGFI